MLTWKDAHGAEPEAENGCQDRRKFDPPYGDERDDFCQQVNVRDQARQLVPTVLHTGFRQPLQ